MHLREIARELAAEQDGVGRPLRLGGGDRSARSAGVSSSLRTDFSIHLLTPDDITSMLALLAMFGEAFDDGETYTGNPPGAE